MVTEPAAGPEVARLVVGVALFADGRLLIARRIAPPELSGLWELPGGKVEPGETVAAAAVREMREELHIDVVVTGELPERFPIRPGLDLAVVTAELADAAAPAPDRAHDAIDWVTWETANPGFMTAAGRPWVPADVPAIAALRTLRPAGWV